METLIVFLLIGLGLIFLGQVLKGMENIFSVIGRIGGWVIGILVFILILKVLLFG